MVSNIRAKENPLQAVIQAENVCGIFTLWLKTNDSERASPGKSFLHAVEIFSGLAFDDYRRASGAQAGGFLGAAPLRQSEQQPGGEGIAGAGGIGFPGGMDSHPGLAPTLYYVTALAFVCQRDNGNNGRQTVEEIPLPDQVLVAETGDIYSPQLLPIRRPKTRDHLLSSCFVWFICRPDVALNTDCHQAGVHRPLPPGDVHLVEHRSQKQDIRLRPALLDPPGNHRRRQGFDELNSGPRFRVVVGEDGGLAFPCDPDFQSGQGVIAGEILAHRRK